MILSCESCGTRNRVPAKRASEAARCGQCKQPIWPPHEPLSMESVAEFDELTRESSLPVLVDFWAAWCGPCRTIAPELKKIAMRKRGALLVAKVDTEALPELAARFGVRSIPTLMLFRSGKIAKQSSGAMTASQLEQTFGL